MMIMVMITTMITMERRRRRWRGGRRKKEEEINIYVPACQLTLTLGRAPATINMAVRDAVVPNKDRWTVQWGGQQMARLRS